MRILKEKTIGLVVDVQEKLLPHMEESSIITLNIKKLVEGMNILKIPMMLTEQYKKGLGATIPALQEIMEYEPVEKIAFSCFEEMALRMKLENMDRNFVVIAGIEAHVCILQTAIDLKEKGYQPVVVEDCVSSRKINDKKIAMDRMKNSGIIITTYESILFELCRYAGTEQFKNISRLVK